MAVAMLALAERLVVMHVKGLVHLKSARQERQQRLRAQCSSRR